MFCPKCGNELKEGAQFCDKCGTPLNGSAPKTAKKEAFKLPTIRGWVSLAISTVVFVLMFMPFIDGGVSMSLLSIEAFNAHALFGVSKIFLIMSMAVYLCNVAVNLIDLGIPSAVKKFVPLAQYCLFVLSQLFTFIACCILKGVTMGAAWYIILIVVAIAVVFELLPGLFKLEEKK